MLVDYDEVYGGYHNQSLANYTKGPTSQNQTKIGFIFYPTVELNIYLSESIILQIATGYNFISSRIGIGL